MKTFNNTRIIAVDTGYGNIKTASRIFSTGITRYDAEPIFEGNILEYQGAWYRIGEGHKAMLDDKVDDEDYYLLTLAAVAMELSAWHMTSADVHLASGLPLTWVSRQRESYRAYLLKKAQVDFRFNKVTYHIHFVGCSVYPQGYAAIVRQLSENKDSFSGASMLADIGNGTMNLLYLRNGRPDESRCWTEKQGVGQCVGMVNKSMMDKYGIQMDEAVVEQVLRTGAGDMQEKYLNCILQAAHRYVNRIFDTLRAHGYDPRIMRLWIVGGGGCLVRNFGTYDASRVTILDDLCATAKGYEYLAYGQMLRKGRA